MGGEKATPHLGGVAMLPGRYGARGASRQSPILRNGKAQNTPILPCQQASLKNIGGLLGSTRSSLQAGEPALALPIGHGGECKELSVDPLSAPVVSRAIPGAECVSPGRNKVYE